MVESSNDWEKERFEFPVFISCLQKDPADQVPARLTMENSGRTIVSPRIITRGSFVGKKVYCSASIQTGFAWQQQRGSQRMRSSMTLLNFYPHRSRNSNLGFKQIEIESAESPTAHKTVLGLGRAQRRVFLLGMAGSAGLRLICPPLQLPLLELLLFSYQQLSPSNRSTHPKGVGFWRFTLNMGLAILRPFCGSLLRSFLTTLHLIMQMRIKRNSAVRQMPDLCSVLFGKGHLDLREFTLCSNPIRMRDSVMTGSDHVAENICWNDGSTMGDSFAEECYRECVPVVGISVREQENCLSVKIQVLLEQDLGSESYISHKSASSVINGEAEDEKLESPKWTLQRSIEYLSAAATIGTEPKSHKRRLDREHHLTPPKRIRSTGNCLSSDFMSNDTTVQLRGSTRLPDKRVGERLVPEPGLATVVPSDFGSFPVEDFCKFGFPSPILKAEGGTISNPQDCEAMFVVNAWAGTMCSGGAPNEQAQQASDFQRKCDLEVADDCTCSLYRESVGVASIGETKRIEVTCHKDGIQAGSCYERVNFAQDCLFEEQRLGDTECLSSDRLRGQEIDSCNFESIDPEDGYENLIPLTCESVRSEDRDKCLSPVWGVEFERRDVTEEPSKLLIRSNDFSTRDRLYLSSLRGLGKKVFRLEDSSNRNLYELLAQERLGERGLGDQREHHKVFADRPAHYKFSRDLSHSVSETPKLQHSRVKLVCPSDHGPLDASTNIELIGRLNYGIEAETRWEDLRIETGLEEPSIVQKEKEPEILTEEPSEAGGKDTDQDVIKSQDTEPVLKEARSVGKAEQTEIFVAATEEPSKGCNEKVEADEDARDEAAVLEEVSCAPRDEQTQNYVRESSEPWKTDDNSTTEDGEEARFSHPPLKQAVLPVPTVDEAGTRDTKSEPDTQISVLPRVQAVLSAPTCDVALVAEECVDRASVCCANRIDIDHVGIDCTENTTISAVVPATLPAQKSSITKSYPKHPFADNPACVEIRNRRHSHEDQNYIDMQDLLPAPWGGLIFWHGRCKEGRPTLCVLLGKAVRQLPSKELKNFIAVTVSHLEYAETNYFKGPVKQMNILMDLEGLGLMRLPPMNILSSIGAILNRDYAGRGGWIILVNAPVMLGCVISAIQGVIMRSSTNKGAGPDTGFKGFLDGKDRILMLGCKYRPTLQKYFETSMLPTALGGNCLCSSTGASCKLGNEFLGLDWE